MNNVACTLNPNPPPHTENRKNIQNFAPHGNHYAWILYGVMGCHEESLGSLVHVHASTISDTRISGPCTCTCKPTQHRSGGTIWSNLSQFLNIRDFFHHLQITQIFLYMVTHMCQTCLRKKIWKNNILQCPPEVQTDVLTSQSRGHYKLIKISKKYKTLET